MTHDPDAPAPVTPAVYHILLALGDGERHGYALLRAIAANPDAPTVGPTTLYRALRHMLDDTMVVIADERPDPVLDDERRRYYRLTSRGCVVAQAETRRLARLVGYARAALLTPRGGACESDDDHHAPSSAAHRSVP